MTGLFVRLYLDEDVSILIKQLLMSQGYDVVTTVEAGNRQKPDREQLAYAANERRAIVTHNHGDFERLASEYQLSQRHHSGIIIAFRRTPQQIARRLLAILDDVTADEMCDQIRYI